MSDAESISFWECLIMHGEASLVGSLIERLATRVSLEPPIQTLHTGRLSGINEFFFFLFVVATIS